MNAANCVGWWEQNGMGRQSMSDLQIQFSEGHFQGKGLDIVGRFTLAGTFEAGGNVKIVKQYVGRHHVVYIGTYDGEGTLFGTWVIDRLSGAWSIKLLKADDSEIEFDEIPPHYN